MMKKFIAWDVDGVLLDTKENMRWSWAAVQAAGHCKDIPFEAYFAEIGRPFPDIMARLGQGSASVRAEIEYRNASGKMMGIAAKSGGNLAIAGVSVYPGVAELLDELERTGVKLGVVTSKDGARTRTFLQTAFPSIRWRIIVAAAPWLRGKPAPDQLLHACGAANEDPIDSAYVGDMLVDKEAAQRAGMMPLHACWGYSGEQLSHPHSFQNPAHLREFLFS